jgi:hypothetical protein
MSQIIRINNLESMTYGVQVQTTKNEVFFIQQIEPWFLDENPTKEQEFKRLRWNSHSPLEMSYESARKTADIAQEVLGDKFEVSLFIKEDK